jgi:small subunit ribosomal protein S16
LSVKLRLRRMGKKKRPFYRIVATDSRSSRDGKYLEKIGHYNPIIDPPEIVVNEERALYWLRQGATPSPTVKSLLSKKGILFKWDLMKKGFDEARITEEIKRWEVLQIERERRREAAELEAQKEAETPPEEGETEEEAADQDEGTEVPETET